MDLGLKDRVALVAASSTGLGKAAALGLAREGAKLALCARTQSTLDSTAGRDSPPDRRRSAGAGLECHGSRRGTGFHSGDWRTLRPARYLRRQCRRSAIEKLRGHHRGRVACRRRIEFDEHGVSGQRDAALDAAAALGPFHRHHFGERETTHRGAHSVELHPLRSRRSGENVRTNTGRITFW